MLSTRKGSSVDDKSDNPWDSCWHMALTALERSTIGEVSGIGVTLIANPWKQLIKNCLWSVNWKVFDMSLRLLVVQSKFPSGKWKSNKTKKKCIHSLDESWLGDGCIRWRLTRGGGWGLSVRWTNGIGACIRHIAIEKKKKTTSTPTNKQKKGSSTVLEQGR